MASLCRKKSSKRFLKIAIEMMIYLYSSSEIKKIALAGKILAKILETLEKEAKVGTKLNDLDKLAYQLTKNIKLNRPF